MKKTIITSTIAAFTFVAMAFSLQANAASSSKPSVPPCKKTVLFCPSGVAYYKCSYTGTEVSPDCWNVGSGCNITLRPC
jgi:hypothetical protein